MIYIFKNEETTSIIYDGTTLTEEQRKRAIQVEKLPLKEEKEGKVAVLKIEEDTNALWWDYDDIIIEKDTEIEAVKENIQGLQQALAEVTLMMMRGGE